MSKYRDQLPQTNGKLFLTDGGIETTLIFHDGLDLPHFAAFDLLRDEAGTEAVRRYFAVYAGIAKQNGVGFVLESPTWRASSDWGRLLGYTDEALDAANQTSIGLMHEIRDAYETEQSPMVISGCIGPRGDGYDPGEVMTAAEAEAYHATQVRSFRDAGADMVTPITMTNVPEAIGITRTAQAHAMPAVVSFTTETDGRLPTGQTVQAAVEEVDAATGEGPAYYMINCAHPSHFDDVLRSDAPWTKRIKGVRANASKRSHAELDEAEDLDAGNPHELGLDYVELRRLQPQINVLGGCCGTDHRHIEEILESCKVPA
jgi:S-methylmethionine-dependent homocysteine/selenocysteine methylase